MPPIRACWYAYMACRASAAILTTWRAHYARLHLHTERRLSSLPGLELPREYGKWVPRVQVVEYLRNEYREHGHTPNFRNMLKGVLELLPEADSKALYDLFPIGPAMLPTRFWTERLRSAP